MKKEILKRIFEFLEEKGEHRIPLKWKLINNEPLTKEDLNVKGYLDLSDLEITSLPKGLKVGGDLDLYNTKITSLPEGLKVGGDLDLYNTEIRLLPQGLEVGGSLYIQRTKIKSLPEGLEVGGDLYINTTPLTKYTDEELREMIKPGFIKGKIAR